MNKEERNKVAVIMAHFDRQRAWLKDDFLETPEDMMELLVQELNSVASGSDSDSSLWDVEGFKRKVSQYALVGMLQFQQELQDETKDDDEEFGEA